MPVFRYTGSMAVTTISAVVVPSPSSETVIASSAVPMLMRIGSSPTMARTRRTRGSNRPGIHHRGEVEHGECEHQGGRCHLQYTLDHHFADAGTRAGEQTEHDRHQNQCRDRGHSLRHDQRHERDDHRQAEQRGIQQCRSVQYDAVLEL